MTLIAATVLSILYLDYLFVYRTTFLPPKIYRYSVNKICYLIIEFYLNDLDYLAVY